MTISVLNRVEMRIESEDDVIVVRRKVQSLAREKKFDAFATAAMTTAASELTRNVWVHARRGIAVVEEVTDGARLGLRVEFRDQGPGIADLERVMRGGYSTAKSMGLGLSGSKRLVDDFNIETTVGQGTAITVVEWKPY